MGADIERAVAGQIRHDSFGKAYQDYELMERTIILI